MKDSFIFQHTYSNEFSIGLISSENPLLILYEAVPLNFLKYPPRPQIC